MAGEDECDAPPSPLPLLLLLPWSMLPLPSSKLRRSGPRRRLELALTAGDAPTEAWSSLTRRTGTRAETTGSGGVVAAAVATASSVANSAGASACDSSSMLCSLVCLGGCAASCVCSARGVPSTMVVDVVFARCWSLKRGTVGQRRVAVASRRPHRPTLTIGRTTGAAQPLSVKRVHHKSRDTTALLPACRRHSPPLLASLLSCPCASRPLTVPCTSACSPRRRRGHAETSLN